MDAPVRHPVDAAGTVDAVVSYPPYLRSWK